MYMLFATRINLSQKFFDKKRTYYKFLQLLQNVKGFLLTVSLPKSPVKSAAWYNITEKEFKNISKWTENIYNIAVVVDYFVANQPEIEELYNLAPVIKSLRQNADLLNAFLLITKNKILTSELL